MPSGSGLSPRGLLGWARVMGALRAVRQPWPNPQARDGLAGVLRGAGFTVRSDERRVFRLLLETPAAVSLLVEGLYLPGVPPERTASAGRALAAWARPPGADWNSLLRRVVAVPTAP